MPIRSFTSSALIVATIALGACVTGRSVDKYAAAVTPAGARVTVGTRTGALLGELIEVRDSGVVLLMPKEVVLVPFTSIRTLTVPDERFLYRGGVPPAPIRERLRLISRFPAGLPEAHMARLLQSLGQETVRTYTP